MVERLWSIFRIDELSELARLTKFVQRNSKLCVEKFLDILFKDASGKRGMSLLDYSNELLSVHGVSISAQGIDERFNDYAVQFLRRLVSLVFSRQLSCPFEPSFLNGYQSVRIWDSTKIELPSGMAVDFPGFGGGASSAGISIQYRYDLKNNAGSSLEVYPATYSDTWFTEEAPVDKNSLEIFDLGYVNADFLKRLDEGASAYVCRLHAQADLYNLQGEKYDLEKTYRWMRLYHIPVHSVMVLVGQKRLPSRLVITLVDEQTYQNRLKKLQKEAAKKGWTLSKQYKLRIRMNLMLTNTNSEVIPDEKVYMLYKFRWQIELIFKSWKSSGWHLENIKEVKYERYMCILYAKLLMIILSDRIYAVIAQERYQREGKILSKGKCTKTLCEQIQWIRKLINASTDTIYLILDKFARLFARGHDLARRKNRINYQDLFNIFIDKSE